MNIARVIYAFKKAYMQIVTSIAFYPVMLTIGLLLLSWGTIYLDEISVGNYLVSKAEFLRIDNADTATSLLSSLLTGLISLVTFTFSMVMIVLTQIMSSFSPRLLPDLVKRRGNQLVMGVSMGTVCFIIVVLSNIGTIPEGPEVPVFSVVVGVFLGLVSLITFIYFIHKISNDVQIGNIISNIYRAARKALDRELNAGCYHDDWQEEGHFILVRSWESGYFNNILRKDFMRRGQKLGLKLKLRKSPGMYVLKGDPFFEINLPLDDKVKKLLEENVVFRHQELVEENFYYGFKHLTEIAVKALSPAINDPGTAINAIDHLTDLFCRLQLLSGQKVETYEDGTAAIIYPPVPFEKTFYMCMASIRAYSTEDVSVQTLLIDLITKISERDEHNRHKALLERELTSIEEASVKDIKTEEDIAYIKALVQKARQTMNRQ